MRPPEKPLGVLIKNDHTTDEAVEQKNGTLPKMQKSGRAEPLKQPGGPAQIEFSGSSSKRQDDTGIKPERTEEREQHKKETETDVALTNVVRAGKLHEALAAADEVAAAVAELREWRKQQQQQLLVLQAQDDNKDRETQESAHAENLLGKVEGLAHAILGGGHSESTGRISEGLVAIVEQTQDKGRSLQDLIAVSLPP